MTARPAPAALLLAALSLAAVMIAGCTATPEHPERLAAAPAFDVAAFFAGAGHGEGSLRIAFKPPRPVHVRSSGRIEHGTLVLDQRIVEGDKPPRTRQWRIRKVAPGRYAGTLSDAAGPVTGEVEGNRLVLRFAMKGGLQATQWLYLQPGGRVALNGMAVRKWGVRIASLEERIAKN